MLAINITRAFLWTKYFRVEGLEVFKATYAMRTPLICSFSYLNSTQERQENILSQLPLPF